MSAQNLSQVTLRLQRYLSPGLIMQNIVLKRNWDQYKKEKHHIGTFSPKRLYTLVFRVRWVGWRRMEPRKLCVAETFHTIQKSRNSLCCMSHWVPFLILSVSESEIVKMSSWIFLDFQTFLFFLFRAERSNKWASRRVSEGGRLECAKNWGEVGRRWARRGRSGKKRNCLQSIPDILSSSVGPRTGTNSAVWLVSSPLIKKWHQKFAIHA